MEKVKPSRTMLALPEHRVVFGAALGALAWYLSAWPLVAGDPIVFGTKAQPAPTKENKLTSEPAKKWEGSASVTSPLDPTRSPGMLPQRRLNSRERRRLQNSRAEKEEWMLVDGDKLRDEEELDNMFGTWEDKWEAEEREKDTSYTFSKPNRSSNRDRTPAHLQPPVQLRSSSHAQKNQPRSAQSEEAEQSAGRPSDGSPNGAAGAGTHTAKDLSLQSLLAPETKHSDASLAPDKNQLTLRDLLNSGASPARTRESQARSESLRGFEPGQPGLEPNSAPSLDMGQPSAGPSRSLTRAVSPQTPNRIVGPAATDTFSRESRLPGSSAFAPGAPAWDISRPSLFDRGQSQSMQPTEASRARPPVLVEPPRRPGL